MFNSLLLSSPAANLGGLRTLLAENVIAWNDGGGRARAAPRPVEGRDRVLRFVTGLLGKYALTDVRLLEVNGAPAAWLTMGSRSSSWCSPSAPA